MNYKNGFYEKLFKAAQHPYMILKADEYFTIVDVNDAYMLATSITRENVIGKPLFEIFPDNPSDNSVNSVSDLHISLDRVVRFSEIDIMGVQKYDIPLRDGSGRFEVKYWTPVNTPILDDSGQIDFDTSTNRRDAIKFQKYSSQISMTQLFTKSYGKRILEEKERLNNVHHLAYHDALTGLPNRLLFADRLRQELKLAKLYIDFRQRYHTDC